MSGIPTDLPFYGIEVSARATPARPGRSSPPTRTRAGANAAIPPDKIPISWAHFGILTHIITATTLAEEVAGYWKQGSVLLIGIALSTANSIVSLFATT